MKISKSLGGVTVLLLAAIGAFATATHQRVTAFYISGSGGCKSFTPVVVCPALGFGCTTTVGTGTQPKQIYRDNLFGTCSNPLSLT